MVGEDKYQQGFINKLIGEKLMAELLESKTLQSIEEKVKVENTKEHILSVLKHRFKTVPKKLKDKCNCSGEKKEKGY